MPTSLPQRRKYAEPARTALWDEIDAFFLVMLPVMAMLMTAYLAVDPGKRALFIEASEAIVCADAAIGHDCFDDALQTPGSTVPKSLKMARRLARPHLVGHPHAISG